MVIQNQTPETVDELIAELERVRDERGGDFDVQSELTSHPFLRLYDGHLEVL